MNAVVAEESVRFPVICRNVRKRFGLSTVLSDVSLSIPKGAVLGLVGRNGAGKTTLIRILVGLLTSDAGAACVLGEPALRMTDASKTRFGYVPQQPQSLSWMSVESQDWAMDSSCGAAFTGSL